MTRIVLPGMKQRKRGAIVNIGSAAATVAPSGPLYAVYAGTKVSFSTRHPLHLLPIRPRQSLDVHDGREIMCNCSACTVVLYISEQNSDASTVDVNEPCVQAPITPGV